MELAVEPLVAELRQRVTPVVLANEQTLPVSAELATLFAEQALVRGRTLACTGQAATSTAMALVSAAVAAGSWLAVIDVPTFGLDAAREAGIALERVVAVSAGTPGEHGSAEWVDVLAAAVDGFEVVVTCVPAQLSTSAARKVATRIRQRGAVVMLLGDIGAMSCDGVIESSTVSWVGLGKGSVTFVSARSSLRCQVAAFLAVAGAEWISMPVPEIAELRMGSRMESRIIPPRMVTVWFADWPVIAAGFAPDIPAAVMFANRVIARTPAAAAQGVLMGQRRRQAQARCPHVELVEADRDRDAREFEPIIRAVAELSPRLDVVEPGWITAAARGPSRYFGGDRALCERLAEQLGDVDRPAAGIGVADGRFASSVAARLSVKRSEPVVVDPGESAGFCAPLPIGWLQTLGESQPELIDLFVRLGLRRLGDLATLPVSDMLGRFGHPGVHAHRLASGVDDRPPSTTDPAPERRLDQVLDDPVAQAGAVVFVAKQLADELARSLATQGRVCTRLVVLLETEHGERSQRSWYRSAGLSASAMVERVRWQLDAWVDLPGGSDQKITGGISLIRLTPEELRADDGQQLGLWGGQSEADRQAARTIARLTTLTSEVAVTVPVFRGGRLSADRYEWVPATSVDLDRVSRVISPASRPWPGSLPSPSPATVFAQPVLTEVVDQDGVVVEVSGRGVVSASPASLCLLSGDEESGWRRGRRRTITAWAGPWPVEERWWEPQRHRRLARFQVLTDDGCGYLVVAEHRR